MAGMSEYISLERALLDLGRGIGSGCGSTHRQDGSGALADVLGLHRGEHGLDARLDRPVDPPLLVLVGAASPGVVAGGRPRGRAPGPTRETRTAHGVRVLEEGVDARFAPERTLRGRGESETLAAGHGTLRLGGRGALRSAEGGGGGRLCSR
jgi:hypothetical protein